MIAFINKKNIIESIMQCFKDRIESFGDFYSCMQNKEDNKCNLLHVYNWIQLLLYLRIMIQ